MMIESKILITGATGTLGSRVLAEALARGHRPAVLVRDATRPAARRRLSVLLDAMRSPYPLDAIELVHGDVTRRGFGLSDRALSGFDAIVHAAACTRTTDHKPDEFHAVNTWGTRNAVETANAQGIPLYFMGTAHSSTNGVPNERPLNRYEASKFNAERYVAEAFRAGETSGAVFRLGQLLGAHEDGQIARFRGFYAFLRIVDRLVSKRLVADANVRVALAPLGTHNLVPVDWAARAIWTLIERDGPSCKAYNLTNPVAPSHEELIWWANSFLARNQCETRFEPVDAIDDMKPSERRIGKLLEPFRGYLDARQEYDGPNLGSMIGDDLAFAVDAHCDLRNSG